MQNSFPSLDKVQTFCSFQRESELTVAQSPGYEGDEVWELGDSLHLEDVLVIRVTGDRLELETVDLTPDRHDDHVDPADLGGHGLCVRLGLVYVGISWENIIR